MSRCGSHTITRYNFSVERGVPLRLYWNFIDVNSSPIWLGQYDISFALKEKKGATSFIDIWNTSMSYGTASLGIHKLEPEASGVFYLNMLDTYTESVPYQSLYYNLQITSASYEDEIVEGNIFFVEEQQ